MKRSGYIWLLAAILSVTVLALLLDMQSIQADDIKDTKINAVEIEQILQTAQRGIWT